MATNKLADRGCIFGSMMFMLMIGCLFSFCGLSSTNEADTDGRCCTEQVMCSLDFDECNLRCYPESATDEFLGMLLKDMQAAVNFLECGVRVRRAVLGADCAEFEFLYFDVESVEYVYDTTVNELFQAVISGNCVFDTDIDSIGAERIREAIVQVCLYGYCSDEFEVFFLDSYSIDLVLALEIGLRHRIVDDLIGTTKDNPLISLWRDLDVSSLENFDGYVSEISNSSDAHFAVLDVYMLCLINDIQPLCEELWQWIKDRRSFYGEIYNWIDEKRQRPDEITFEVYYSMVHFMD